MNNNYDVDLTVNDALALLMDLSLNHIRSSGFDFLLDELEQDLSRSIGYAERELPAPSIEKFIRILERTDKAAKRVHEGLHYYSLLIGEIAKIRHGILSTLLLVHDEATSPMDYTGVIISRASFMEWSRHLAPWQSGQDQIDGETADSASESVKFTRLDKEKHQVMIALLLECIAHDKGPAYTNKDKKPNLSRIAADIRALHPDIDMKGYSEETLKDRFADSLKTRRAIMM
jgi:hypothetical protein